MWTCSTSSISAAESERAAWDNAKTLRALVLTLLLASPLLGGLPEEAHALLASRCVACHGSDKPQGGLDLTSRESLLRGGVSGPAVTPGAGAASLLYLRAAGDPGPRMPLGGAPLRPQELETLASWIDEGAAWTQSAEGPDRGTAALTPRRPKIPAGGGENPVDRFLVGYWREAGLATPAEAGDAVFARRAWFDLHGLPPSPDDLRAFLDDDSDDKRSALIDCLLEQRERYAEHWISYWNDLLRNDEGVIYHGGRESITPWLLDALRSNKPYDRMVRELLDPRGRDAPEGFLVGVNWRGVVNASQTPPMQAAQNSAQVFLGINLKCASCHDSFINQWKLADSYGLAGFFSDEPLELVRCDVPTGRAAELQFLFPSLGSVDAGLSLGRRRTAVAELFTHEDNGRFARTIVNRYWKKLIGRGLVEPADDMDQPAWDADLLDWLAVDFVDHGYDLEHLLRRILGSKAYQSRSAPRPEAGADYQFQGPHARRLSAEQFSDAISAVTGEWPLREAGQRAEYSRDWRLKASPLARALGRPVRDQVFTERNERATTLQALELLNGGSLTRRLRRGAQRLLNELPPAPASLYDSGVVRRDPVAGEAKIGGAEHLWLLVEDQESYDPSRVVAGWLDAELVRPDGSSVKLSTFTPKEAPDSAVLTLDGQVQPDALAGPVPGRRVYQLPAGEFERLRFRLAVDDASKPSDVNPRVRFFVFDRAPDRTRLVQASGRPPVDPPAPLAEVAPTAAVRQLFEHALSRPPSKAETAAALELLQPRGGRISSEGLEDLLWSLALLPDFQVLR